MLNGLWTAETRGRLSAAASDTAAQALLDLPVEPLSPGFPEGWLADARAWQLTAYDAQYVRLALDLGLPLSTMDRAMSLAAEKVGVTLFDPQPD